jgi:drug/metabolite transporter (DMT)-like permease
MVKQLAALSLLVNAFTWGISWWPFRQLQGLGVHPLWATALIYVGALICLCVARPTAWRSFRQSEALWWLALAAGLTNIGFNWAVTVGDVVRVVLLFYLMPTWVVILAWPLLGEKPNAASLGRLVLALAGVGIILNGSDSAWPWPSGFADWLGLVAGFCFALTNILLRKLKDTPAASNMLVMFGGGALIAAMAALAGTGLGMVNPLPMPPHWLLWVSTMSLMFLAGNLGLQYGAARLSASATSIIMLSEVVFAGGSAVVLGVSEVSVNLLVGGALVVLASLLSTMAQLQAKGALVG